MGSLIAALASYLDARAHGGTWLVRIEDVDTTRCDVRFKRAILESLAAFGLEWDGDVVVQSTRTARYEAALRTLVSAGVVYACACTRREISDSAIQGIDGPVYPDTCRDKGLPTDGVWGHAMRVRTDDLPITFTDRIQGACTHQLHREFGDFVVKRRDGLFAYQLAVVVDDAGQGVTHVVRGADLLDSTTRQIHLQALLGFSTPQYLHVPIATNDQSQKLSKQTLAPAIRPAEAVRELNTALQFLGQPPCHATTPKALLDAAIHQWHVDRIPSTRSCHISLQTDR